MMIKFKDFWSDKLKFSLWRLFCIAFHYDYYFIALSDTQILLLLSNFYEKHIFCQSTEEDWQVIVLFKNTLRLANMHIVLGEIKKQED